MLENLTSRISKILNSFSGTYKLSEFDIKEILKKLRQSFIEADVSWDVTKQFLNNIRSNIIGVELTKKISPSNILIKVINDELINIMKGEYDSSLNFSKTSSDIILLVGLQGVGKTSTCVKLGNYIKKKYNKTVLTTSCDIYRPAAIKQLRDLSFSSGIDFFYPENENNVVAISKSVVNYFKNSNKDVLLFDTAGRLHIDSNMLDEIKKLISVCLPVEILLVVDGMTGQDAVKSTEVFNNFFGLSGFVVTKMDGDTRGGALLSITHLTKKPIKFICYGEGIDCINVFYPNRIASRILGMGDLDTLLEDVKSNLNNSDLNLISSSIKNDNDIDLNVFKIQISQMLKLGGFSSVISKMPNMGSFEKSLNKKFDDKYFINMISVINSMTLKERKYPHIINGSRKRRIASGSGTNIQNVNSLLKQFNNTKKLYKKHSGVKDFKSFLKDKFNFVS